MVLVKPTNTVLMYIFSCIICIFSGFLLRVCLEYKPETFTFRMLVVRALITSCVGFISTYVYRDYKAKIGLSIELYLCLIGFFAVFAISVFDKVAKIGLKSYSKLILKRLLAYSESTEGENKNDL